MILHVKRDYTAGTTFFAECLGHFILDKVFDEFNTQQRILDKHFIGKEFFAEYFF
jgi:hypothetical protein